MDLDSNEDKYHADRRRGATPTFAMVVPVTAHFSKFYNPSEHLAVDEVIVKFKGRIVFKHYISKKRKHFGIKMFKLCDSTGYICI